MAPADLADADRETRLNNILADYFDAVERGEHGDREGLLTRHPDLAVELTEFFTEQEQVFGLAGPLRSLIRAEQAANPRPEAFLSVEARSGTSSAVAPRSFGDYEVLEEMARGGMGVVYRARQRGLNRLVALKVIRAGEGASAEEVRRFRNEAETVALLNHPHVVPVYEVGEQAGQLYFSMKLIEGGSLAEHLPRYRDDPKAAAGLVATVARAVHHAHQRGVLHRDLKPSNILLDEECWPHVTDFGLARRVATDSSLTQSGAIVGTPSYLAPEQTTGQKGTVTTATDVYGLGAVLYALVTGRPPFQAENVLETLVHVREREPRPPRAANRRVDRDLETICLKCLQKEPQRRYESALALAEDLERWLAGEPIHARRISPWRRLGKWIRRRPALAAAVVSLLMGLAVLAGSIGWIVRDATARRTAMEQAIALAWDESLDWQRQGRLPEALSAARRADGLLAGADVDEALRQRVRTRLADLELLDRLENVRLEKVAADKDARFDWVGADALYEQLFRDAGLDMKALMVEEAGERIRESTIATELAAVLDHWSLTRWAIRGADDPSWKALLRIARVADPDARRTRLREAVERRDTPALAELAASKEILDLAPSTLRLLTDALVKGKGSGEQVEGLLRKTWQRYPDDFWANHNLAEYLYRQSPFPRTEESLRFYTAALALRPQNAGVRLNLGTVLSKLGKRDEAIIEYRQALQINPKYAEVHSNLGIELYEQGKRQEGIAAFRQALEINPKLAEAHINLGRILSDMGEGDEAIAHYYQALQINPKSALAHANLGACLLAQGKPDEAIVEYRQALQFNPNNLADVHYDLGLALRKQGKLDEAIHEYREAIRVKKDDAQAHIELGITLRNKSRLDEAIAEYREAIRIKKDDPKAHFNLAYDLSHKNQLDEAIAEYREAIRLQKDYAEAYCNLGALLCDGKHDYDGAIAAFRMALRINNNNAEVHCNLGATLQQKGQFVEALSHLRRGHELGSKKRDWNLPSAQRLRQCERLIELDGKLPEILSGQKQPADAAERLALAWLCQQPYKQLQAAASRFYTEAFADQPQLAADLAAQHRYNAACSAALAGCGQGKDADKLDAKERARLRQQALDWLRADLKAYGQLMKKSADKAGPAIAQQMQHWLKDTDFAGVRGPESLARLPEAERKEWLKLWEEVEALRQRAAGKPTTASPARH
jgi:serine/threonine-protein kinase